MIGTIQSAHHLEIGKEQKKNEYKTLKGDEIEGNIITKSVNQVHSGGRA